MVRVTSLLAEYAGKLNDMERELYRIRERRFFVVSAAVALLAVAGVFMVPFYSANSMGFINSVDLLVTPVVLLIAVALVPFFVLPDFRRARLLREDIRIASSRLLKVVRAASQFREHGVHTFSQRLELDLRLAEAEAALRHAAGIVGAEFMEPYPKRGSVAERALADLGE